MSECECGYDRDDPSNGLEIDGDGPVNGVPSGLNARSVR
jgi:hypothetical protein